MEEPVVTENTIAEDWFKQELERHESSDASVNTIVVLHEACYGHRFARPKTTKTTLGLIVERPERIEASTMGISAAYVRLGERHNEGQYAPDPRVRSPAHLPFKIKRTDRTMPITSPAVTAVHGVKWMEELKVMSDAAAEKLTSTGRETERPIDPMNKNKPAFHAGDLYLCANSRAAFEGALGGVCEGVDAVFNGTAAGTGPSQAFVCIRPPGHHCSADFPSGFCWLNNVHVGIQHAVKEHGLTHAAIIDFDLHHGDGSQKIAFEHNARVAAMPKNTHISKRTAIGYYSIHDINSYPCENGDPEKISNASICIENAHNQSIWNVHLQPWKTEQEFWDLYGTKYMVVLEKARIFLRHYTAKLKANPIGPKAKGAIFISAGFDASEHESAGMQRHSVNVPTEFYARFTRDIVALAQEEGTGVDGRVISVLEGGYSDKALISGVLSHVSGLCHGQRVAAPSVKNTSDGLADEMARLSMGGLSGVPGAGQLAGIDDIALQLRYNSEWWTSEHLDALVEILNPTPVMPAFEAVKGGRVSTFASPTQASKMKVIDPNQLQRRASAHFNRLNGTATPSRPVTPPPPAVHWTVASQELCKLLIPDRQTKSHTAAELAAPKIKKERQSAIGLQSVPAAPVVGRQLREKRGAAPAKPSPPSIPEEKRVVSKGADRRRTIAANEITNSGMHANGPSKPTAERMRRRSSIASVASNMSTTTATNAPPVPVVRPKLPTNGSSSSVAVKKTRLVSKPPLTGSRPTPTTTTSAGRVPSTAGGGRAPSIGTDLDALVAKTQKLKIRMPSNEEYVARQKAVAAPKPVTKPTSATATAPRKVGRPAKIAASVVPKKAAPSAAAKAKSPTDDLTHDIPGTGAFQLASPTIAGASSGATSVHGVEGHFQLEASAPSIPQPDVTSPFEPHLASATPPAVKQMFLGYAAPAPASATHDPLRLEDVGVYEPPVMQPTQQPNVQPEVQNEPVAWSATGHIPFASGGAGNSAPGLGWSTTAVKGEDEAKGAKSIWDVPDTPARS